MEAKSVAPIELRPDMVASWCDRFVGAWNSHEPEQLAGMCTEDILWEDPYIRGGSLTGKAALRAWLQSLWTAMPDLHFIIVGEPWITLDNTKAGALWQGTARFTGRLDPPGFAPTGGPIEMNGMDLHEFRDGLLCRVITHMDTMDVARQIGAGPEPDTRLERMGVAMQRLQARRMRRKT